MFNYISLPFNSCHWLQMRLQEHKICPESSNEMFTQRSLQFTLYASGIFRLMMTSSTNRNHGTNHVLHKYISLTSTPCYFPRIDGRLVKLQLWKGGNWHTAGCKHTHGSIHGVWASLYQHHPFLAVPLFFRCTHFPWWRYIMVKQDWPEWHKSWQLSALCTVRDLKLVRVSEFVQNFCCYMLWLL